MKKRFMALLLTLAMVFSLAVAANAATLTINNDKTGDETYEVYKFFDVDETGTVYTFSKDNSALAGAINNSEALSGKMTAALAADGSKYVVTLKDSTLTGEALASALDAIKDNATKVDVELTYADGKYTGTIENGYYLILSGAGTKLIANTANGDITVDEKNTYPTVTGKEVYSDAKFETTTTTATIGQTVYYKVTVNVPAEANLDVVLHDQMNEALKLDASSIKVVDADNKEVTGTVESTDTTFTITYKAADVAGKTLTATYSAVVTDKFADNGASNAAWITYGSYVQPPVSKTVSTYATALKKTDGKDSLNGAEFKLQTTDGTDVPVVKVADGEYRVAAAGEEGVVIEAGNPIIKGLDNNKKYQFVETKAPTGYNMLDKAVDATLTLKAETTVTTDADGKVTTTTTEKATDDAIKAAGIEIVNTKGTALPSTGGMGTTILYIVGAILVIGAGVVLVSKKRATAK